VNSYIIISTQTKTSKEGESGCLLSLAAGILRKVLPAANPDFDHLFGRVASFHVELGGDGFPQREVGLDATGRVLTIAPWRDNLGLILDTEGAFDPSD